MNKQKIYAIIPITNDKKLIIQDSLREGYLEIRTYINSKDYTGYTKNGVVFLNHHIPKLIEGLENALMGFELKDSSLDN